MGFMDLFSNPSSPLAILTAAAGGGAPPMGTAPQLIPQSVPRQLQLDPSADGQYGGITPMDLNLTQPQAGVPAAPWGSLTSGGLAGEIQSAGQNASPDFWSQLHGIANSQASGPSTQSISDLINSLIGPAPTLDQVFNSQPYEDAISKLSSNKATAASGINDSYTKAIQQLASVAAQAKQDQAGFASQVQGNGAQAQQQQQAFLQSIGANGAPGSALGAMLQGQAARMATDQANQANTNSRLASVQNNDLSQANQDAALGQMGSINQLNAQTAGAQSKIGQQEVTDRGSAMKDLASMLTARQGQAKSLLDSATGFIDKNTTSVNSRNQVESQLNQMAGTGDPTATAMSSILHGIPGKKYAAPDLTSAMQILADPNNKFAESGVNMQAAQQMLADYYGNTTTKQQPDDITTALKQYLQTIAGIGA